MSERKFVRSANGVVIHVDDMIKIVGKRPHNSVVGYVGSMERYMDDGHYYRITEINFSRSGEPIIRVNSWNWDIRNIFKDGDGYKPIIIEPVTFDPQLLDV